MAPQCSSPSGASAWTFGLTRTTAIILVSILGSLPLLVVLLGPKLGFWAGRTVGIYLQQKTAGRKAQILELAVKDERKWEEKGKGRRDSDDWESVEGLGTAENGEKGESEWDGIVGFFHPFWYFHPFWASASN